jgi:hypothetical protein
MKTVIICGLVIGLLTISAKAENIRVKLRITGKSETTNLVSSFLTRELRGLHDISIVNPEDETDFIISILVLDNVTRTERSVGHTLSTVITAPIDTNALAMYAQPDYKDVVIGLSDGAGWVMDHQVFIGPPDTLKEDCVSMIASIDTRCFEKQRETNARIDKFRQQLKKQKYKSATRTNSIP